MNFALAFNNVCRVNAVVHAQLLIAFSIFSTFFTTADVECGACQTYIFLFIVPALFCVRNFVLCPLNNKQVQRISRSRGCSRGWSRGRGVGVGRDKGCQTTRESSEKCVSANWLPTKLRKK